MYIDDCKHYYCNISIKIGKHYFKSRVIQIKCFTCNRNTLEIFTKAKSDIRYFTMKKKMNIFLTSKETFTLTVHLQE